jgi:hypothetical protein
MPPSKGGTRKANSGMMRGIIGTKFHKLLLFDVCSKEYKNTFDNRLLKISAVLKIGLFMKSALNI